MTSFSFLTRRRAGSWLSISRPWLGLWIAGLVISGTSVQAQISQRSDNYFDFETAAAPTAVPKTNPLQVATATSREETIQAAQPVDEAALSPELTGWVRWLLLRNLPEKYIDEKKWGMEKDVFDGLEVEREGLKIETRRKWKAVNHGRWKRYEIELINPQEQLTLEIINLHGSDTDGLVFDVIVQAKAKIFGRISRWIRGVQLASLSMNATAEVRLKINCSARASIELFSDKPGVQLVAEIKKAEIELVDFDVERLSQIRGDLAEELGNGLRTTLDRKLADYGDRLAEKMNRQIAKQKDSMRLSLEAWTTSEVERLLRTEP
jgi:hypothetical protein